MDMDNSTECFEHKMMRKRYFHTEFCDSYLFKSWYIGNIGDAVSMACAVYILAILYEGLKSLRSYLNSLEGKPHQASKNKEDQVQNTFEVISEHSDDYSKQQLIPNQPKPNRKTVCTRTGLSLLVIQSLLHALQTGFAYVLMFAAMTFNMYLFVGVCAGMGTGYLIFTKVKWIKEQL